MTEFTFHTTENTEGETQALLQGVADKFGFVPNLFAYMAEAPHTIQAYIGLSELLPKTGLSPAQQHIGMLAISVYNQCDFCVVPHQAFAKAAQANSQTVQAILNQSEIENAQDSALVEMLLAIVKNRGKVNDTQMQAFFAAGFNKGNLYDLILLVTIKTLSNYANQLGLPQPNPELLAML